MVYILSKHKGAPDVMIPKRIHVLFVSFFVCVQMNYIFDRKKQLHDITCIRTHSWLFQLQTLPFACRSNKFEPHCPHFIK